MATIGNRRATSRRNVNRVSPIKPGLRGARNWATAQIRAASYSRQGFWRLTLTIVFTVFLIVFIGLWLGGFLSNVRQVADNFTRNRLIGMGFVVERIDVRGEGRMREHDVRQALGVKAGDFLFDMDVKAAQKRIEALSWVDRAVVRRLWPNRIVIYLIEREPYALWQKDGVIRVVDHKGTAIVEAKPSDYPQLRLLVGANATEYFADIENVLAQYPDIEQRVNAMIFLETERWDILMNEGQTRLMLPREGVQAAVHRIYELQMKSQVLDRDISIVDLRLPDRITLRPAKAEPA